MPTIYKLRMLSDENDNFVREYEIDGKCTLLDLHEFISGDLGYDRDGIVSFFASDPQWNKLVEFTLMDMGEDGPVPMQSVTLAQVLDLPQARLIYLFDMFNDRAFYLESAGAVEVDSEARYPKTVLSVAPAPDQYEPTQTAEGGNSIFDEALGEFGSFEGDEYYDDEY